MSTTAGPSGPESRVAETSGYPGCQIHESIIVRTGRPDVDSIASHRSLVSVFEWRCVSR